MALLLMDIVEISERIAIISKIDIYKIERNVEK